MFIVGLIWVCGYTAAVRLSSYTSCRFFSLNILGLASPSSSTNEMPGLTLSGGGASTTLPVMSVMSVMLLYLAAFAEASKIVVTAVAGGGVGMQFSCCTAPRHVGAFPCPCTAQPSSHHTVEDYIVVRHPATTLDSQFEGPHCGGLHCD